MLFLSNPLIFGVICWPQTDLPIRKFSKDSNWTAIIFFPLISPSKSAKAGSGRKSALFDSCQLLTSAISSSSNESVCSYIS